MAASFIPLRYSPGEFEAYEIETTDSTTKKIPCTATIKQIHGQFGNINPKKDTTKDLKYYDLTPLIKRPAKLDDFCNRFRAEIRHFSYIKDTEKGIARVIPRLDEDNYKAGIVWIYDPRVYAASFKDTKYTEAWRIIHELGHCIVEPFLHARYGESYREGQLGKQRKQLWGKAPLAPASIRHGQRAIEWESLAFRAQRMLSERLEVSISDLDYQKEYNGNMADAVFRVITGEFGEPGNFGFIPHGIEIDLLSILSAMRDAAEQIQPMTKAVMRRVFFQPPNLKKWRPVRDDEINEAINDCLGNEISYVHNNPKKFPVYHLPRL